MNILVQVFIFLYGRGIARCLLFSFMKIRRPFLKQMFNFTLPIMHESCSWAASSATVCKVSLFHLQHTGGCTVVSFWL